MSRSTARCCTSDPVRSPRLSAAPSAPANTLQGILRLQLLTSVHSRIEELAPGRAYALCSAHQIDQRVSWFPSGASGVAPINCYLLREGRTALLIDTGLTFHRAALLDQVRSLAGRSTELKVMHTRIGEYLGTCNTTAVLASFGVTAVYAAVPAASTWVDFDPTARWRTQAGAHRVTDLSLRRHPTIDLAGDGSRPVHASLAALRLLPTFWIYDEVTGLLCTSDSFSHATRRDLSERWLIDAETDTTTIPEIRDHLLNTRYWWLADADTTPIRRALNAFFAERHINILGPAYGCIFIGHAAVTRQYELLDAVLAERSSPLGTAALDA